MFAQSSNNSPQMLSTTNMEVHRPLLEDCSPIRKIVCALACCCERVMSRGQLVSLTHHQELGSRLNHVVPYGKVAHKAPHLHQMLWRACFAARQGKRADSGRLALLVCFPSGSHFLFRDPVDVYMRNHAQKPRSTAFPITDHGQTTYY